MKNLQRKNSEKVSKLKSAAIKAIDEFLELVIKGSFSKPFFLVSEF